MRTLLAALCLATAPSCLSGGELRENIDSYEQAFYQVLYTAPEIYLDCYYQVEKQPWVKELERLESKASIVEVLRCLRTVGERIEFGRVLDGKDEDISKLAGSLNCVKDSRNDQDGFPEFCKSDIAPEEPAALCQYSADFTVIASAAHKPKAQQACSEEHVTCPVVVQKGGDKPQPLSEGRCP